MTNPHHELIMTQQLVIHYRSEVSKYKDRIAELELHIEKEIVRNKYLQNKLRELNNQKIASYKSEIEQLKKKVLQLEVEMEEERILKSETQAIEKKPQTKEENILDYYGYFNYSIILPKGEDSTVTVISDLTVVNTGRVDMKNVILCIKVSPINKAVFSGKISYPHLVQQNDQQRQAFDWVYALDDWMGKIRKDGEYWIRSNLMPNVRKQESLTFKSFEILMEEQEDFSNLKVEGYIYCEGNRSGRECKNRIIVKT